MDEKGSLPNGRIPLSKAAALATPKYIRILEGGL